VPYFGSSIDDQLLKVSSTIYGAIFVDVHTFFINGLRENLRFYDKILGGNFWAIFCSKE
jgi:hypothetical protein